MKTIRLISAIGSLLLFNNAFSQDMLPAGVSNEWYTQQTAAINNAAYRYVAEDKKRFIANNPANHLGFEISPVGYTVHNLSASPKQLKWSASFETEKLNNLSTASRPDNYTIFNENQSSIVYKSGLLNVEYINTTKGLQQNFIINKKQPGTKNITITIKVKSSLQPEVVNGNRLVLKSGKDRKSIQLIYDQLKVWDANENVLPSAMAYNKNTGLLTITTDDSRAQYPVTVDPLNRVPEWSTSADGIWPGLANNLQLQVQTTYGYSVTGLGDINGDGFDDVAISAPTMLNIINGNGTLAGVGAVFIYLGSANGLSQTPDKILQPSIGVAGALFGYSVAAGDVTGDGKNDIIVGAPLDSYQTTASAVAGQVSVNVKAGKVYIFRSEDLLSSANPSPFLELKLQGAVNFSSGIAGLLASNINVNALFGFSVATVKDLNGDGKDDIVVGAPAYLGTSLLAVQNGAAFVYYSNNLSTPTPTQLNPPSQSLLGVAGLPSANTNGLLFGFSLDGIGDYNKDGYPDIVVGAPAGINLSSLGGVFSGQFLGGSAYVYYGTGSGVQTTTSVKLEAASTGLLSNTANLFGFKVKGIKDAAGAETGNVVVGAPAGSVISNVVNGLQVKAGQLHVFQAKSNPPGTAIADQVLTSPRATSILGLLSGQTLTLSLLYGTSVDNLLDANNDGIGDLIVGEPLSTSVPLVGTSVVGGATYVYLGKADGTFQTNPAWDLNTQISPEIGVNASSLIGWSVAGAGYTKGHSQGVRSVIGGPSNSLDFGTGLLNLGNTMATLTSFVADTNGIGKAYSFDHSGTLNLLPVTLASFTANPSGTAVNLQWIAATELNLNYYELQRSTDRISFNTIAMVFKKEAESDDYNYPDKNPKTINYYRLKMVDKDGNFTYSSIVSVSFGQDAQANIQVAPNPVQADINVRMTGLNEGSYRIELMNAAGQIFVNKSINISGSTQTTTISRNSMASGIYWVNVYDNTDLRVKSIKVYLK